MKEPLDIKDVTTEATLIVPCWHSGSRILLFALEYDRNG